MNCQQMIAFFFIVVQFYVGHVLGRTEKSSPMGYNKKGQMTCNGPEAITVTYDSANRVELRCVVPLICNKPGVVDLVTSNCDSGDGRFLHEAEEIGRIKSGKVRQKCNKYVLPRKDKYTENCLSTFVKDSVLSSDRRGRKRLKRESSKVVKADIFNSPVSEGMTGPFLPVKTIKREPNGYRVTMCVITCRESQSEEEEEEEDRPNRENPRRNPESQHVPEGPSGGSACFSEEDQVQTRNGPVAMRDLNVGDKVLTYAPMIGKSAVYEPVNWFIHREPDTLAEFVTLETASGRALSLTLGHLISVINCAQDITDSETQRRIFNENMTPAKLVSFSNASCLMVENQSGSFNLEPIVRVTRDLKRGIYAPITGTGNLIVNGIAVSCFSEVESHSVQIFALPTLLKFKDIVDAGWGLFTGQESVGLENSGGFKELPTMIRFLVESSAELLR